MGSDARDNGLCCVHPPGHVGACEMNEPTRATAGQRALSALEAAVETYRERNALYQDSFSRWGPVFRALFAEGVHIRDEDDWNRVVCLGHIVDKLVRYTADFEKPHEDSLQDLGVYAFILAGLDEEIRTR